MISFIINLSFPFLRYTIIAVIFLNTSERILFIGAPERRRMI
jgi:hypothetical protein